MRGKKPLLGGLYSPISICLHPHILDLLAIEDRSVEGLEQLLLREPFESYEVENDARTTLRTLPSSVSETRTNPLLPRYHEPCTSLLRSS